MKRELDNLGRGRGSHHPATEAAARAPQPWKRSRFMALLITAAVVGWVGMFFALFYFLSHKHR